MKKHLIALGFIATLALSGCVEVVESEDSLEEPHDVVWVTPTGIPTLAFYDQGDNPNWTSYPNATDVAVAFATDDVDAIVFDGLSGLTNIKNNNRNYIFARWISGGTFYLVSTKHTSLTDYEPGQTVDAFVRTGNAAMAFNKLAESHWNWSNYSDNVTYETGVASVKEHLENNPESFDYYLIAQPVLFASTNALAAKGITLNVVANLQTEWSAYTDGGSIPAAALFLNKSKFAKYPNALSWFVLGVDLRIGTAVDDPAAAVTELNKFTGNFGQRFGFQPAVVNALQSNGKNGFGLTKVDSISDPRGLVNSFASSLGLDIQFDSSLFIQ